MTELQARDLDAPDQTQTFDNGTAELVTVGGSVLARVTFRPGWRWSQSVKPLAGTDSCQTHHLGYAMSGHLRVRMDDGLETDVTSGDAYNIPPGHDGWIVGDETFVGVEFRGTPQGQPS